MDQRPKFLPKKAEVIPEVEMRHSVGHNIVASYKEHRDIPKENCDAISLVEFIGVSKGSVIQNYPWVILDLTNLKKWTQLFLHICDG